MRRDSNATLIAAFGTQIFPSHRMHVSSLSNRTPNHPTNKAIFVCVRSAFVLFFPTAKKKCYKSVQNTQTQRHTYVNTTFARRSFLRRFFLIRRSRRKPPQKQNDEKVSAKTLYEPETVIKKLVYGIFCCALFVPNAFFVNCGRLLTALPHVCIRRIAFAYPN